MRGTKACARPSVPLDMRERYIEYALLRAGIRYDGERVESSLTGGGSSLVIVAGAAFQRRRDRRARYDAAGGCARIEGVVQVRSDPHGALPALGTLAPVEPTAVVQLANGNVLENVGHFDPGIGAGGWARARLRSKQGETAVK